jgi:hypothetical protein
MEAIRLSEYEINSEQELVEYVTDTSLRTPWSTTVYEFTLTKVDDDGPCHAPHDFEKDHKCPCMEAKRPRKRPITVATEFSFTSCKEDRRATGQMIHTMHKLVPCTIETVIRKA